MFTSVFSEAELEFEDTYYFNSLPHPQSFLTLCVLIGHFSWNWTLLHSVNAHGFINTIWCPLLPAISCPAVQPPVKDVWDVTAFITHPFNAPPWSWIPIVRINPIASSHNCETLNVCIKMHIISLGCTKMSWSISPVLPVDLLFWVKPIISCFLYHVHI